MAINVTIRSAEQVGGTIESEIDVFGTADDRGKDYVLSVRHPPRSGEVASERDTISGSGRGELFKTYFVEGPAQTIIGSTPVEAVEAVVFEAGTFFGGVGDELDRDRVEIDRGAPGDGTDGGEPSFPGGSDPGSPGAETPDLSNVSVTCRGLSSQSPEPGERLTAEFLASYTGSVATEALVTYQLLVDGQTAGTAELRTDVSDTHSIAGTVPTNLSPGRTVDVSIQAIDIRR